MPAHILQLPKMVWLVYVYVNSYNVQYVQMHVHKIFSLHIIYVRITIKAACVSSKHDDQNDN